MVPDGTRSHRPAKCDWVGGRRRTDGLVTVTDLSLWPLAASVLARENGAMDHGRVAQSLPETTAVAQPAALANPRRWRAGVLPCKAGPRQVQGRTGSGQRLPRAGSLSRRRRAGATGGVARDCHRLSRAGAAPAAPAAPSRPAEWPVWPAKSRPNKKVGWPVLPGRRCTCLTDPQAR